MNDVWSIVRFVEQQGAKPTVMVAMRLMETAMELARSGAADASEGKKVEQWVSSWGGAKDTAFFTSEMALCAKAAPFGKMRKIFPPWRECRF